MTRDTINIIHYGDCGHPIGPPYSKRVASAIDRDMSYIVCDRCYKEDEEEGPEPDSNRTLGLEDL